VRKLKLYDMKAERVKNMTKIVAQAALNYDNLSLPRRSSFCDGSKGNHHGELEEDPECEEASKALAKVEGGGEAGEIRAEAGRRPAPKKNKKPLSRDTHRFGNSFIFPPT